MDSYNEFNSADEQELTFPEQEPNFPGEQELNFANEQPQLDEEGENLDKVLLDMFNSSPRATEPILNMPDTSFNIDEFLIELMSIADPPPSQEIDFNITERVEEDSISMLTNTDEEMLRQTRNQLAKIQEELMNDNVDDIEMAALVEEDRKKFNCQYCRKKFSRKQHKTFHENNCEQKPGTSSSSSSSKQMRQTRMDEFADNNMSVTKDATQVGGANLYHQHPETWGMPLKQSTFNETAATHRKTFDEKNTENLMERLWNVLNMFKDTISLEKRRKKSIKYFFTTKFIFHKNKNTDVLTDPPITFNTKVVTLTDNNKDEIEQQLKEIYDQIVNFIEEFTQNGCDWVLDHFIHLDLGKNLI